MCELQIDETELVRDTFGIRQALPRRDRDYKIFKVDAYSGQVVSMKIRSL